MSALLLVGAVATSTAANAAVCSDVYVLGSRGSGDSLAAHLGVGAPGERFYNEFVSRMTGTTVTLEANPYSAVGMFGTAGDITNLVGAGTWTSGLGVGAYHDSVNEGKDWLRARIATLVSSCPVADIVLTGYSQGAQVTADIYQELTASPRAHIEQ